MIAPLARPAFLKIAVQDFNASALTRQAMDAKLVFAKILNEKERLVDELKQKDSVKKLFAENPKLAEVPVDASLRDLQGKRYLLLKISKTPENPADNTVTYNYILKEGSTPNYLFWIYDVAEDGKATPLEMKQDAITVTYENNLCNNCPFFRAVDNYSHVLDEALGFASIRKK